MLLDPQYLLLVMIPTIVMGIITQGMVKSAYHTYSRLGTRRGLSGQEAARYILDSNGLYDVPIQMTPGHLSDHYDPTRRVLRLSPGVYQGRSIASVGIAAHEAGHALQHAESYIPLTFRNQIFPLASFGSNFAIPLALGGLLFYPPLITLGILLYAGAVLFSIVTLPVEFNASSRAKSLLMSSGIITQDENEGVSKVLGAAAMTYVATTLSAILTLLYLLGLRNEEQQQ